MAKKKQFAGKKTKLAELPLTRVLEQRAGDAALYEELQTSAATAPRQLILSLERAAKESWEPLAAAYLQVLEELTVLQADLQPVAPSFPTSPDPLPTPAMHPPRHLKQALRQARKGLQDLHRLLSK
jgi:hypothetical protein